MPAEVMAPYASPSVGRRYFPCIPSLDVVEQDGAVMFHECVECKLLCFASKLLNHDTPDAGRGFDILLRAPTLKAVDLLETIMSPERFVAAVRIVFALILILLAYLVWNGSVITPPATSQRADPGDPVALFNSTGIKECEYDAIYKFEGARAVLLDPEDFARAREFLIEAHGMEASAILFTYSPIATEEMPGQPALIPLKRSGDTFCALGVVGSHSVPLFLSLEEKYQSQMK